MTKKEKRIFDCVSFEDWQGIVEKHKELAKSGSIASTQFLFNRVFGVPKIKDANENQKKQKQLELDFSKLSTNELQELDKITDKARVV